MLRYAASCQQGDAGHTCLLPFGIRHGFISFCVEERKAPSRFSARLQGVAVHI